MQNRNTDGEPGQPTAGFAAREDVLYQEESGEAFLLHVPTGRYFGLNATGVVVWKALQEGDDPVPALLTRWPDVPEQTLRRDSEAIVGALLEAELIGPAGRRPPS